MSEQMLDVGKIINTHGVRGEVRVMRLTDFEERFNIGETLYLIKNEGQILKLTIAAHRIHKQYDLLLFEGYNNINDVEDFKGAYLRIKKEQLTDLPDGEYYYHEIIGCVMYTIDHEEIGVVKDILPTGANDVWIVDQQNGKEQLIPYIKDVVKKINVPQKKVYIEVIEGLLD